MEEDLKTGYHYQDLAELRGLCELKVVPGEFVFIAKTKRQQKKWRQKCKAFEALLKPIVTLPKQAEPKHVDSDESGSAVPLYPGSAVCFGTSELRRIGVDCDIDHGLSKLYQAVGDKAFDSELAAVAQKSAAEYQKRRHRDDYL